MREIQVVSGPEPFRQTVSIGPHVLVADEPPASGGGDEGPEPHELLLSALGTCTAMTLRVYARRKEWPLERVTVHVRGSKENDAFVIERTIEMEGALSDEQRERLREIAEKCPVHKTLTGEIRIHTTLGAPGGQRADADPATGHG